VVSFGPVPDFPQVLWWFNGYLDSLLELLGLESGAEMLWRFRGGFDILLQMMSRCPVRQA
jgi:hypothetical protein